MPSVCGKCTTVLARNRRDMKSAVFGFGTGSGAALAAIRHAEITNEMTQRKA